ncbi:glutamine synthetase-like [Haliotis rufescens]|uniref:glutamine synthetase-like n=1 Tax=Haliotis rufescens TaxID=6454 RepID=UPI001EAFAE0D|nr:glutamine synthetase-like [Haliotis rufescens]
MSKLEEVKKEIAKYDYVRFSLCDLNSEYRGQVVAGRHAAKYLEEGIDIAQGILRALQWKLYHHIDHEKSYKWGKAIIYPDLDTLRPIPWAGDGVKVAEKLCESRWKKDNSPQDACPRYVARKQLQRLDEQGYVFFSGYEIEFSILEKETLNPIFECWNLYSQRMFNKHSKRLLHFDKNFKESNIDVERYHTEAGPGMCEATMKPKFGIESTDMAMNIKEGLMEMATNLDHHVVTFMTFPISEKNPIGTNTHLNISLWNKNGESVFYDASAPDKLSDIAKYWIAGILRHSKALCAFCNPTVNCYRTINKPFCPSAIFWAIEEQNALLRVKNESPSKTYIENRLPSGKCNSYLVLASTIAAGLDGVINKLECPPEGSSDNAEILPHTLEEALEELEQDDVLVSALGSELVTWFVKCKRVGEIDLFKDVETDEERFALEKQYYLL